MAKPSKSRIAAAATLRTADKPRGVRDDLDAEYAFAGPRMSFRQIGEALGISRQAAQADHARALQKIRAALEDMIDEVDSGD